MELTIINKYYDVLFTCTITRNQFLLLDQNKLIKGDVLDYNGSKIGTRLELLWSDFKDIMDKLN